MDFFKDILDFFSFFDLGFIVITILSLIKCTRKGFVLSILSASKWLLAYVITLILFPKARPYVEDVIDNEYILDITLGISDRMEIGSNLWSQRQVARYHS